MDDFKERGKEVFLMSDWWMWSEPEHVWAHTATYSQYWELTPASKVTGIAGESDFLCRRRENKGASAQGRGNEELLLKSPLQQVNIMCPCPVSSLKSTVPGQRKPSDPFLLLCGYQKSKDMRQFNSDGVGEGIFSPLMSDFSILRPESQSSMNWSLVLKRA